ncbi:MAG: tripartite tricarboxylate transporter permease [Candidatus Aenigmatarchaeota archaeon]|nr:tripartite tricarboxylate transporter permease [Candidatus Aenigmarchaeota archaeon]
MLDLLFFSFFGIVIGLFAGLLPGLHPNQLYFFVFSIIVLNPNQFIVFAASMAIANIISNYIPSLFLSVPDPNTVTSILPGHRMVLKGFGKKALAISIFSAISALIILLIALPAILVIVPSIHKFSESFILVLIITFVFGFLLTEGKNFFIALFIFLISGVWGLLALNSNLISSEKAIFPALTGLFGISSLLFAERGMKISNEGDVDIKPNIAAIIIGIISGIAAGILPGIGESQISFMILHFFTKNDEYILSSMASMNIANTILSVIVLMLTGKVRSGLGAALSNLYLDKNLILLFFGACLFSAGLTAVVCLLLGNIIISKISSMDYQRLSRYIILLLSILVFALTGFVGLFILIISTFIGILPVLFKIKRSVNMGFLTFPVIIYFIGYTHLISRLLV